MLASQNRQSAVVVGGGIIGIACAHYLSAAGLKVKVIDRGKIAGACSHANCGYVCPSHVLPLTLPGAIPMAIKSLFNPRSPFKVKIRWNVGYLNWMRNFAIRCRTKVALAAGHHLKSILDASIEEYRELMRSVGLKCEWRDSGLLHVFETKAAFDSFRRENEMVVGEFQHGARELSPSEVVEIEPALRKGLAGGFLHEEDSMLRPDLLNRQWRKQLESRGVQFVERCELLEVSRSAEGEILELETSQGKIDSDLFVFSMGAWSEKLGKLTGFNLPIQPAKGYSITLNRTGRLPNLPILFPEKKVGVTPFEYGFRIGSMMEFVGFDSKISDSRIEQLKSSVQPFFELDSQAGEVERWSGFRPMTYDTLPVIGRLPLASNGLIATGHSMLGISMAPTTGRLIAELALNKEPHLDVSPFDPLRFQ